MSVDSTVLPAREGPAVVQGKVDWQGLRSRDGNRVVAVSSTAGSGLHTDWKNLVVRNTNVGVRATAYSSANCTLIREPK